MAWKCSGATKAELIHNMAKNDIITSEAVVAAMEKVDRARYVRHPSTAYEDSPQTIGYGATISAPHMHAHAVETLLPFLKPGARVLDVGSGSGYLCAVMHQLVQSDSSSFQDGAQAQGQGKVIGIEHVSELVDWSLANLRKDGLGRALDEGQIKVVVGDGRKGLPEDGPFDAIHVGAAAPTLPLPLVEQLARPGRMFIPVGTDAQRIWQVDKDANGEVSQKALLDVRYVPLTDRDKQR